MTFQIALAASTLVANPNPDPTTIEAQLKGKSLEILSSSMRHKEAALGTIVASQSKKDPDHFFYWTRDAALVMTAILKLQGSELGPEIEKSI